MSKIEPGKASKTLLEKLGFTAGDEVYVETTPDWYSAMCDEAGIELTPALPATHVHLFCNAKRELSEFLKRERLEDIERSFWVSWPKKASGVQTDLTEQYFRDVILPLGWVDVKVAAIDDTWSGLKFLRRKH